MTLASIRNTKEQGSWLLWPTVQDAAGFLAGETAAKK